MKNALETVDTKLREAMDAIEVVNWGKGEKEEWDEKEDDVREEVDVSGAKWEKMKRLLRWPFIFN